ncbi:MAG: zinc ribbon domain-containing protein [Lachnospiraceae bacterium]|nr:zinc ribbon domain-containing protein [Lachnospiraceae bacterium]
MKKCANCNVVLIDDNDRCPLCHCVTQDIEEAEGYKLEGVGGYPDFERKVGRLHFASNLVAFLSIIAAGICLFVDYQTSRMLNWSLIVVLSLLFINVVINYAVIGKDGYRQKIVSLTLLGITILFDIDSITGYYGWSVNYVFPAAIIALDIMIIVLMIVNRRNWQSYIATQLLTIVFSILLLIANAVGWIHSAILCWITFMVSALLFVGTVMIGDEKARSELKRKFYF